MKPLIKVAVSLCVLLLSGLVSGALPISAGQEPEIPSPPTVSAFRQTAKGEIVVPMIFPMLGGSRWSDTYGAPRDGGQRQHAGQDLPGPKMRPLLACFDGVWYGNSLVGDNGCVARYMHINNDHPGTDDGQGGAEFAYAPGISSGVRVRAGQHVAYCGDSGNAEDTIPHLHFELEVPGKGTINAAASLRVATRLQKPRYTLPSPESRPAPGQLRVDGEIVSIDTSRGVVQIRVAGWSNASGKITPQTRPMRRWVRLTDAAPPDTREPLGEMAPGDVVAAFGQDPGGGKALSVNRLVLLHRSDGARQQAAAFVAASNLSLESEGRSAPGRSASPATAPGKVIALTNAERAREGLAPLRLHPALSAAAQAHAEDMAAQNYFDHTDRQGGRPSDRAQAHGYFRNVGAGENIFMGPRTAQDAVRGWMNSLGHRRNILNSDYRAIGVGMARGRNNRLYWVQVFGAIAGAASSAAGEDTVPPGQSPTVRPTSVRAIGFDFESGGYDRWGLSGDCWGNGPEGVGFAGRALTGWQGNRFATTAHARAAGQGAESGSGRATSPSFVIPGDATALIFRIAGGRYPNRCCLNLIVTASPFAPRPARRPTLCVPSRGISPTFAARQRGWRSVTTCVLEPTPTFM